MEGTQSRPFIIDSRMPTPEINEQSLTKEVGSHPKDKISLFKGQHATQQIVQKWREDVHSALMSVVRKLLEELVRFDNCLPNTLISKGQGHRRPKTNISDPKELDVPYQANNYGAIALGDRVVYARRVENPVYTGEDVLFDPTYAHLLRPLPGEASPKCKSINNDSTHSALGQNLLAPIQISSDETDVTWVEDEDSGGEDIAGVGAGEGGGIDRNGTGERESGGDEVENMALEKDLNGGVLPLGVAGYGSHYRPEESRGGLLEGIPLHPNARSTFGTTHTSKSSKGGGVPVREGIAPSTNSPFAVVLPSPGRELSNDSLTSKLSGRAVHKRMLGKGSKFTLTTPQMAEPSDKRELIQGEISSFSTNSINSNPKKRGRPFAIPSYAPAQLTPKKKGRPFATAEAAAKAAAKKAAKALREANGEPEPKRRAGRPARTFDHEYVEQESKYVAYKCEWKNCTAELHNLETLHKHVGKVHDKRSKDGLWSCQWKGCGERGLGYVDESVHPMVHLKQGGYLFTCQENWENHFKEFHLPKIAWHQGDGPKASPLGKKHGTFSTRCRLELDADIDQDGKKQLKATDSAWLKDSTDKQVIPSVENQQLEEGDARKLNKQRFRGRKHAINTPKHNQDTNPADDFNPKRNPNIAVVIQSSPMKHFDATPRVSDGTFTEEEESHATSDNNSEDEQPIDDEMEKDKNGDQDNSTSHTASLQPMN
ncbi:hypothetical protein BGZ60DRAFT_523746 [Tricladium varicosporioides]|nr:hypothetical protein BGZ60DRAFT_523746 [Hymenoscyphus varicosporioides]